MKFIKMSDVEKVKDFLAPHGDKFVFLLELYVNKGEDIERRGPVIKLVALEDVEDFIKSYRAIENCHIFATENVEAVKKLSEDSELYGNKYVGLDCRKYKESVENPMKFFCCFDEELKID